MATVASGKVEVDRCRTCGAAWFDPGEIRELTQGRLSGEEEAGSATDPSPPAKEEKGAALRLAWGEARGLPCPRCAEPLHPEDFQLTGAPVFRCAGCGGMLVSRRSANALSARFRFQRDHAQLYESLGASMAGEVRRRMNRRLGPDVAEVRPGQIPIPVLVPLSDGASPGARLPVAVYGILFLTVALSLLSWTGAGGVAGLEGRLALPSGTGFSGVPKIALLLTPFLNGGIVPLVVGCLFLFVLGDNVEDRLGRVPFLLFYLFCGAVAGAAHVVFGKTGMPAALGSAGAVAGVLGAYLVFFPDVPIEMYGMGRTTTVPAYLFACAWAVAVFLWGWGPGPLSNLLNPGPYSLAGHLAGFGTGAACAALWKTVLEESIRPA
ncbi:MAG: rhomboid family intramembrane serine protease [Deltaproteobacteria bacterium]|nr:MAG: rhomboid family intramembrane serine protease [Deltaproteobacteria bacterium]